MNAPELRPADLTWTLVVRHFNPAWFAAVMGTAVLPLALSFTTPGWLDAAVRLLVPLSVLMFVACLVPWVLKMIRFPADSARDFNHPLAASFLPTMPIALLVLGLDTLKFGHLFVPLAAAQEIAIWMWTIGSAGVFLLGFAVLVHMFRDQQVQLQHANFGWFIPPVSQLLIPVGAFELAGLFPAYRDLLVGVSAASLGIGFFLFLFVGAAVFHRYLLYGLPQPRLAATVFIGMAPTAIIAVGLFKLCRLVDETPVLGLTAVILVPLARLAILMNWGLAAWWFVLSLIVVSYYRLRLSLPFALSWWAFTFPSGAVAVASGVAWQITGFGFLLAFHQAVLGFLLLIWTVVLVLTVRGLVSRRLLLPTH